MSASGSMKSTRDAFIKPSKSCEKIQMKDNLNSGNIIIISLYLNIVFTCYIFSTAFVGATLMCTGIVKRTRYMYLLKYFVAYMYW